MEGVKNYIIEAYNELVYKVTWPTWKELISASRIVILASIIFSLVVYLMDFVFGANAENGFFKGILYYVYKIFS